jgi:nicotinate-nucleotide adenylyltransferase
MAGLIGVFGGTFDPPHLGHMILADEARSVLRLENVLWVVTAQPPHKPVRPISPAEARVDMVQAAIEGDPGFAFSPADIDRPAPHYAEGTLDWLSERQPGAHYAYLIGGDSLRDLHRWHDPTAFIERCVAIGVMRRPGVELDLGEIFEKLPGLRTRLRFVDAPLIDISGYEIRRRVRERLPFRYMVPPRVADYIAQKGLYRWDS